MRNGLFILLFAVPVMGLHAQLPSGSLLISIQHYLDEKVLTLDSTLATNGLGQTYRVSKLKYYLSNFRLVNAAGASEGRDNAYLVDEDQPESKHISLIGLKSGSYRFLEFIIGVDSLHNCSGAQSGMLDPVQGMFWAWNSGYIFLKLEGHSPASTAPGHFFEYHIGGYAAPTNSIRKISLPVELLIDTAKQARLTLRLNIQEILDHPNRIDFGSLPSVTDTKHAALVADNYADAFSIRE